MSNFNIMPRKILQLVASTETNTIIKVLLKEKDKNFNR